MSQGPKDRVWVLELGVDDFGRTFEEPQEDFRARVRGKMLDAEATGDLVGGAFLMRPLRREVADAEWVTFGWRIQWVTEGTARRTLGEFDHPQPEPEPELVTVPEDEGPEAE